MTQQSLNRSDPAAAGCDYQFGLEEGDRARAAAKLAAACHRIFSDFDDRYLTGRLPTICDPSLAYVSEGGNILAFKLGYRRGEFLFYSWLGGVDPAARGKGLAHRLMVAQHDWARTAGYKFIETRTRADNDPMLILNLRHGFTIRGYETDSHGVGVVTLRKTLE